MRDWRWYSLDLYTSYDDVILGYDTPCLQTNKIYVAEPVYNISSRKLESLKKIAYIQRYYQCNPIRFIEDFFNIILIDGQAWAIQRSWNCPRVLLCCTRGFGKSTIIDVMDMAKSMLNNNYWSYIASGSGSQAEQTFMTLERIANDNIDTMVGSTGYIFKNEVVISNANGDGFSHSSNGFKYTLYNGSFTQTLNSNIDKKRGARGSVIFDECGFLSEEMMQVYAAFAIVNKSFKTGRDASGAVIDAMRQRCIPEGIPNQLFYISSASSDSTPFYTLYRDLAKRQLIGDPNVFVAQINCEVAFKPTVHGEVMAPLLSRDTVETAMRTNPEKARREYYCEFTTDAGVDAAFKRGDITKNSVVRKPVLFNDTGQRKIVITYDPARTRDNSVILISEIYDYKKGNGATEKRMRLLNCVNLVDIEKKDKTPMQTPQQIEYLKNLILDYNMGGDELYSNIVGIYIDAGSGGAGINIADYLMEDWIGKDGNVHRGLIDKEYSADYISKFPNAVPKVHLLNPKKYKSMMYEATIEMVNQGLIEFTADYDNRGYLTLFDIDEKLVADKRESILASLRKSKKKLTASQIDEIVDQEISKLQNVKTRTIKLDWQEECALTSIDALKEEIVNIVRIKREGGDAFELCPEKKNKLHDDRAYTFVMAGYVLSEERRKRLKQRKPDGANLDLIKSLPMRKGKLPI